MVAGRIPALRGDEGFFEDGLEEVGGMGAGRAWASATSRKDWRRKRGKDNESFSFPNSYVYRVSGATSVSVNVNRSKSLPI